MNYIQRMVVYTLAGLSLWISGTAASGDVPGGPYQGIVGRNVFGLNQKPPAPEINTPPPPSSKVFLTGITTILGNKCALLKTTPPARPGEPAKEQAITLAEGQRDGDIEVLEINEKAGTVKISNFGTITMLDFDKDGVKVAAAPPGPGGPMARPGGMMPGPGGNLAMLANGANQMPRTMRLPMPTAQLQTQPQAAASARPPLTAEQQIIMVEAERMRLQQQGLDKMLPPVPPTPLTQ
jgi:hypothetical protein